MRKMKKMAALCMAGMMALSLAACSGGAKETTAVAPAETQAETAAQTTAEEKAQETTSGASSGSVSPEEFAKQEHCRTYKSRNAGGKQRPDGSCQMYWNVQTTGELLHHHSTGN